LQEDITNAPATTAKSAIFFIRIFVF